MEKHQYPKGEEREKVLLQMEVMILNFFRKSNTSRLEKSSWAELRDEVINGSVYPNISVRMFEQCIKIMAKKGLLTKRERKGSQELHHREPNSVSIWLTQEGANQAREHTVYFS